MSLNFNEEELNFHHADDEFSEGEFPQTEESKIGIAPVEAREAYVGRSKAVRHDIPKEETRDEDGILKLVESAGAKNWSVRYEAFEQLAYYFQFETINSLNNFEVFERIITVHFDHLNDAHFKIILLVQDSLCKLFNFFYKTLEPYLGDIMPKVLLNLTDKNEKVNKSAFMLLSLMKQSYGGDTLVPYILRVLESYTSLNVLVSALEFLSTLIKE